MKTIGALGGLAILATACATPVGVHHASLEAVQRTISANAISVREPSSYSRQILERFHLRERYDGDPEAALGELRAALAPEGVGDRIFALAELWYLRAEHSSLPDHYLSAAVYAYAFLFPHGTAPTPDPLDPRSRLAADIYNLSLAQSFRRPDSGEIVLESEARTLPFGSIAIAVDQTQLAWGGRRLEQFVPAARLQIYGLRNRYRQAGLGAALAAGLGNQVDGNPAPAVARIPPRLKVSVTLLMRIDEPRQAIMTGELRGKVELYTQDASPTVRIDGREIPLEYESSVAVALTLDHAPVWDTELAGFFKGDLVGKGRGQLWTMTPYRRGRVPVVFVHGTASSPARWAEMLNELNADRLLASRYQFWLFTYDTGNAILYSGMLLREALKGAVAELDPDGTDPALRRMILIGHSQGGLLINLCAVDSGSRFWANASDKPVDDLHVSDDMRQLLRRTFFFTRLPFVDTLIFISTPHLGSETAAMVVRRFRSLLARLVTLPVGLVRLQTEIIAAGSADPLLRRWLQEGTITSVDNMSPRSPFIKTLSSRPIVPGVRIHSIISVEGDGPVIDGSDGVVSYKSAHLDGALSELVVRSSHSVEDKPEAIEEVRRILRERLDGP